MKILVALLIIIGGLGLGLILIYNSFVKLRAMVREGWSGIEVQLKRRANLIPNLVSSVKGYMAHEKDRLNEVTELRARSMATTAVADKAAVEHELSRSIVGILAVAENYPDLKANQNFLQLQTQLAEIEEQIQMARRYYNGTVRNLNVKIDSFPSNIVAGAFDFQKADFFEIETAADRTVPQVNF